MGYAVGSFDVRGVAEFVLAGFAALGLLAADASLVASAQGATPIPTEVACDVAPRTVDDMVALVRSAPEADLIHYGEPGRQRNWNERERDRERPRERRRDRDRPDVDTPAASAEMRA